MVYRRSEGGSSLSPPSRDRASSSVPEAQPQNAFRNDGSFLEMFKRMQEANANQTSETIKEPQPSSSVAVKSEDLLSVPTPSSSTACTSFSPDNNHTGEEASKESVKRAPLIGKRRGGRILPTGMVKKKRGEEEGGGGEKPKDAWSLYMAEVRRYKETSCEEDGKTRPLVK